MPGLNDPNDSSFSDPSQAGAWQWNAEKQSWEPTDPVARLLWDAPKALGLQANTIKPTDPGASLNTGMAGEDRSLMAGYLQQLQGQAATGGGAWEQALAQNTDKTKMAGEALGQSTPGLDAMSAGRSIGNAKAGADQRAVGQGNLLRAQTQQQAQGQLADVLAGQGALDAQEASAQAAAQQGMKQANMAMESGAAKNRLDTVGGFGQMAMGGLGGMSEGGQVPGQPRVFGDDEANDIVPAKLSPGEIVIPRSITQRPDAAQAAAAFVEAVKGRAVPGQSNFPGGGEIPPPGVPDSNIDALPNDPRSNVISTRPLAAAESATGPDGSTLDTRNYRQTRDASLANAGSLLQQFTGNGPSTAPQAMQNAQDSTIAEAMQAQAGSRRPVDVAGRAAEKLQGGAGNAAGMVAGESQRGGAAFADAVNRQRAQDLALATAEQQAAWRNTMMEAGLGLEQQNQLRGLLSGAGQGAVAMGGMFDTSPDKGAYHYDTGTGRYDTTPAWEDPVGNPDEWAQPFAEGGVVASHLARQGTRRAPSRKSSDEPTSKRRAEETGKRLRDRITPPIIDSSWQGVKQEEPKQRDNFDPDEMQLEYAQGGAIPYANGGPIDFTGRPESVGPGFFARLADYMNSPVTTADAGRAIGLPVQQSAPPQAAAPMPSLPPEQSMSLPRPTAPAASMGPAASFAPPAPKPAAPPAPAPIGAAPRPAAPRPAAPRPAAQPSPYDEQKRALGMKADVEATQADAQAGILGALQADLQANAIAQKEQQARASEAANQQLTAIQQAREELKNVDVSVDPDRYMARKGWGGKVAAVIGLVLGAIGNDNGVNRAAMLLQQQIDRDLDAQKSEHELMLRKGQSAVDSAQSIYSLSRQATQDDIAANLAARGTMLDLAKNQVDLAAAKTGAPMAKANLANLSAALELKKQEADNAMRQRGFDNHIKKMAADTDRMQAEAQMTAAGNKAATGDKAQAALIANVEQENRTIQERGQQLKALIKKHGTTGGLTGPGQAEMKQTLQDMATAAAKLRDPTSVARSSEVEAELKNLFQPGFFQQADTALASVDNYLKNMEKRRNDAYQVRGLQAPGAVPSQQPNAAALEWLRANPNDPRAPAIRQKLGVR